MKIKQVTEKNITLTLPSKQRYLGFIFVILGLLIPLLIYIFNGHQIILVIGSPLATILLKISIASFLGYLFIQIASIYYFFSIRNNMTAYGQIILLGLNIVGYIALYSTIFLFSSFIITGIYLLTHFKTLNFDKTTSLISYHERIFALFYTSNTIPFSEINEIVVEYKPRLGFRQKKGNLHRVRLYFLEKDPGIADIPTDDEKEIDTVLLYQPQILRKTLIHKPFLIDSCFFNFKGYEMTRISQLLEQLIPLIGFSWYADNIQNNIIEKKFKAVNVSEKS
ncbi:MAG TPA: hypothetical protein VMV49_12840 [Candidatus Deferrimicrobium sp.]|nr:hypothetical protein [Candidatus Deferrimicrobium sp.]